MQFTSSMVWSSRSCCASVSVQGTDSTLRMNVDMGIEGGAPVNAVMGVTLLCCGDGELLRALVMSGFSWDHSSWRSCSSERTALVTRISSLQRSSIALLDHGQYGIVK